MKQVILMRQDLHLPKGKLAVQAAHAAVEAVLRSDADKVKEWRKNGSAKIVVKVKSSQELLHYLQEAKTCGLITATISDAGRTVIAPGTMTCGVIGPDKGEKIDAITGHLTLL